MSNFILNIARRSAGLGPGALVEPAPGPIFSPTVGNLETRGHEADAEDRLADLVQGPSGIPGRRKRFAETKQEFSSPANKRTRAPLGDESRLKPDANRAGLPVGNPQRPVKAREGDTGEFTSGSSVAGNTSLDSSIAAPPIDPQLENLQSIIEPKSPFDLRYPHEQKANIDKLSIDGPGQAREAFNNGLTPRLSEPPAAAQSDQITPGFETAATGMIEPATAAATSSNSLWGSHQQPGAVKPLEPQPIHVRIGTIEVRAEQVPPSRVAMSALPAPQSGFDDYKSIR